MLGAMRGSDGLGALVRGPFQVIGQITGLDAPVRALERLAASTERAAAALDRLDADQLTETLARLERLADSVEHALSVLDRLDAEVGTDRVRRTLGRLDGLTTTADEMNLSLKEIERLVLDLRAVAAQPLDLIPMPKGLRRRRGAAGRTRESRGMGRLRSAPVAEQSDTGPGD